MLLAAGFENDAGDDGNKDAESDGGSDDEPEWADDDGLGDIGDLAIIIDSLSDVENAEEGEIIETAFDVTGGVWDDELGKLTVVVFGRENYFAGEVILDSNNDIGSIVDVAVVFEFTTHYDFASSGEAGYSI